MSCTTTSRVGAVPLAAVTLSCRTNSRAAAKPVTAAAEAVVVLAPEASSVTVLAGLLACCISLMVSLSVVQGFCKLAFHSQLLLSDYLKPLS